MTTATNPQTLVSAEPARQHIELLRQTMHWHNLIAATGCASETLYRIYHGKRTEICATTEAKILNTPPQDTADPAHLVDATGTKRRVRALQAIGHTYLDIANAGGGTPRGLQKLATGNRSQTKRTLAEQVEAVYERLSRTPAEPSRKATLVRNIAAERDWDGPEAWDGIDIDDPDAQPRKPQRSRTKPEAAPQGAPLASSKPRAAGGNWRHYAACRDQDPELFFPIGDTGPALLQTAEAKSICGACGVKNLCLQWALETGQDSGIWGGLTEDERRAAKRRAARKAMPRQPARCGTRGGYKKHVREHTAICDGCRNANNAAALDSYHRNKQASAA